MPLKDKEKKAAYHKAHYKANKEKVAAQQKIYRKSEAYKKSQINYRNSDKGKKTITANNKDYCKRCNVKIATTKKNYRENNKEKIADSNKIYRSREGHREKLKAYHKIYYKVNKEKINTHNNEYRNDNKEKITVRNREYSSREESKAKVNLRMKNKRKADPVFRLNSNIRSGIRGSLKNGNCKNGRHWENLVGYTFKKLILHLEKQFTDGMTWENYGKWHIDHKIPLSAHNFTSPEHSDFQKAWSLKNLQPMWAKKNISKGAKLAKPFQPSLLL